MVRFDVEEYLAAMGELIPDDPSKGLVPAPSVGANGRYYAKWELIGGTYRGVQGRINIWNAAHLEGGGDTNIGQVAVLRGGQTTEAGKIEAGGFNSGNPTFFAYFTTNGYTADGNWIGGYAGVYDGFVQYSNTVAPLDQYSFVSVTNSIDVGGDYRLWHYGEDEVGYGWGEPYEYQAGWWLSVGSGSQLEWVGYWPRCHDAAQGVACSEIPNWTWDDSGIDVFASYAGTQGEVNDHNAPHATTTDMGSGKVASDGYRKAAYMEWIAELPRYAPETDWELFHAASSGTFYNLTPTDSNCYSRALEYFGSSDNWFFYGGGGKGQSGCNY
jgi:hypothetical protein